MFSKNYTVIITPLDINDEKIYVETVKALNKYEALRTTKNKYDVTKYNFTFNNPNEINSILESTLSWERIIKQHWAIDFNEQIFEIEGEIQNDKRKERLGKISHLDLVESKKMLIAAMTDSYLNLRTLNLYTTSVHLDLQGLRYVKTVSGIIAHTLHNAPRLLVDRLYMNESEVQYLNSIKEMIVDYEILMQALKKQSKLLPKNLISIINPFCDYNFDVERFLVTPNK